MLLIGDACERRWNDASDSAVRTRLAAVPFTDEIRALQEQARSIPIGQRKAWLKNQYEDHSADISSWLHKRAGTPFDERTGEYEGTAPRKVTVSKRPLRGARKRIISDVAAATGLTENVVDNLWQAYRRFQKDVRSS